MKALFVLLILGSTLLAFQNCGESAHNSSIFERGASIMAMGEDCLEDTCEDVNHLWLKIREYEPYRIQIGHQHFTVSGQCGIGTFKNHSFLWELREGFGRQDLVGKGFSEDICAMGRFTVPVMTGGAVEAEKRYSLTLELVGITERGGYVSNPMPANLGSLDIIFTIEPPQ